MDDATREACLASIGRSRATEDAMAPDPARKLQVLSGAEPTLAAGDPLPPTWHWLYLADETRPGDMGADGHERLGLFLPPAPFHRRMWAAGEVRVHAPLVLGTPARRTTTIASVEFKTGRSGALCFARIEHRIAQAGAVRVEEVQTVVYRDAGPPEPAMRRREDPVPEGFHLFTDIELFRYSALTYNAHRIHWDRDWCREVEGYPGLVVHGPLLATRLCDALARGATGPLAFSFRAVAPVFETTPIRIETADGAGRILRGDGSTAMEGRLVRG